MEENFEPLESRTYSTGSTKPPKKSGCLIAALLMLAIFFIGIVSSLGLINFRLLRRIEITNPNETESILVSDPEEAEADSAVKTAEIPNPLGLSGESIPLIYQMYYQLPNGLLITHVAPGSCADAVGIEEGDILLQVENQGITGIQELDTALSAYVPGDTVKLLIYRQGKQYSVSVTLGEYHD